MSDLWFNVPEYVVKHLKTVGSRNAECNLN